MILVIIIIIIMFYTNFNLVASHQFRQYYNIIIQHRVRSKYTRYKVPT